MSSPKDRDQTGQADEKEEPTKPLFWVGRSLDDLRDFPEEVRQTMGFGFWQAQQDGKHVDAKPLKGFLGREFWRSLWMSGVTLFEEYTRSSSLR